MKLKDDEIVCGICQEIIKKTDSKEFVSSVEWGSFSGTKNYSRCCKTHELYSDGFVPGRAYA